MPFDAVFFDFDGLILDTEMPDFLAWREVFGARSIEFPHSLWVEMVGRNIESVSVHPADLAVELAGGKREAIISEHKERRTKLIHAQEVLPGVVAKIEEATAMGAHMAVVSSSSRGWVEEHLALIGLRERFETLFCGYEGLPAKPDPALYRAASEHFGVAPSRTLALEDSPNGVAAAKAAGLWCVTVPNELTGQLDLAAADLRFESLEAFTLAGVADRFGL